MMRSMHRWVTWLIILVFSSGCTAGLPKPATFPPPTTFEPIHVLKFSGFETKDEAQDLIQISIKGKNNEFHVSTVLLPKAQAEFIRILQEKNVAHHYILEGPADFTLEGVRTESKGGVYDLTFAFVASGFIFIFPWLCPWGDKATGDMKINVLNKKGILLKEIHEKGETVYGNWIVGAIFQKDDREAEKLRKRLLEIVGAKALEVMQQHRK